jgi:hypothetical protein
MSEEMQLELEHTLKTMRELKEAADTITTLRAALVEKMAMAAHEAWVRLEEEREPFCIVNHWSELHKDERREAMWSMSDALDVAQAHIRADVLEEAARELDRRGFKELADTAIRTLKEAP